MGSRSVIVLTACAAWIVFVDSGLYATEHESSVRFNRDIRPILSDKCFHCHGPDTGTRAAHLRLDDPASVFGSGGRDAVVVPGDVAASTLIQRITAENAAERMPPADSGRVLTTSEKDLLSRWVAEGAEYQSHWAFITPESTALPTFQHREWPRNPIDHFVLSRLEQAGLQPTAEADPRTLIRRVTLDLTGLPPTPQEVDAFLTDSSPQAYEKLVDRLLASPRYGERMAVQWLDAARYADTHGYLFDTERSMWRWRDWVIQSFNRNQPFDEFTIEQLAGDLLAEPTPDQLIATAFNRNHIINNEAGATPEEYFVENILDRVNTTSTVWMGLTVACAQCHDHKYDPLSQREYYELYAFFNNVPESGLDGFNSNAKPLMLAPTAEQSLKLTEIDQHIVEAEAAFAPVAQYFKPGQAKWEREFYTPQEPVAEGLMAYLPFDGNDCTQANPVGSADFKEGAATHEAGMFGEAAALDGQRYVDLGSIADFDRDSAFTLSAWVYPTTTEGRRAIFSRMEPPEVGYRGYTLQLVAGAPVLYLVSSFPENVLMVQAKEALEPHQWHHVLAVHDGSGKVEGVKLYVNGKPLDVGPTIDALTETIHNSQTLQVGNGHPVAKFQGRLDEVRVYGRALSDDEIARLPGNSIHSLLAVKDADRSDEVSRRIRDHYLEHAAPDEWRKPYERLNELRREKTEMVRTQPTVMVMEELDKPRETRMLVRGAYDAPGETVSAATPAFLPPLDETLPKNRLGLARWLTDPSHPLTARVAVNRYWQMYFGEGLVRTSDNFGLQGEWPSHPDLLDWLATEFIRSDWNVKAMQRLIVTSATYRQSSQMTPHLLDIDPHNRLLARGPRHRLSAEIIRDSALAISGLLVERQGGPSVKPYQPENLWREVAFDVTGNALTAQVYEQDQGSALYRRSLYTFWKRTAPPPTMMIFDGPDRERCTVRRERTNTPLQALVLMNDPTYVEAARKLAERMLTESGSDPAEQIAWGFELTLSRQPSASELGPLLALREEQLARFAAEPEAAKGLLGVGESPRVESLPVDQLAAYTIIANILLNLNETITKG